MSFWDQFGCWLLFSISVADPLQKLFFKNKRSFLFFFGVKRFLYVIGEICYFLTSSQKAKLKNWQQPYYFLKSNRKMVIKTASKTGFSYRKEYLVV